MEKFYKKKDISKDTVELEIIIPADAFKTSYDALLQQEAKGSEMEGFRKGSVPTDVVEAKSGDQLLLKTFERVAPLYISQAVTQENLAMVAPPEYKTMPKLGVGEDLTFTIVITVMPEYKLGNMKKVKVETKEIKVDPKEVDALLKQIEGNDQIKADKGTDKWAAEVGAKLQFQGVKSMDDLKKEVEKVLTAQKESVTRREVENDALNQAIKISNIEVPQPAIDYEAKEREHAFEHELEHRQMTVDDFIKQNGTTMEKMKEMWQKDAREAIEADEFLTLYAKEKGLTLTDEELEEEIKKVAAANPTADQSTLQNEEWRTYVKRVALKQKAFEQFMNEVIPAQK